MVKVSEWVLEKGETRGGDMCWANEDGDVDESICGFDAIYYYYLFIYYY